MKRLFADSIYFIALLNERDATHGRAVYFSRECRAMLVTTRWVLVEFADALCEPAWRERAGSFIEFVMSGPGFAVIEESDALFARGLDLYRKRQDKSWSLTDCISFVVMADEELADALTGDRHFEQAGFSAVFAQS